MEEWKEIKKFPDYEVSSSGNVRRIKYNDIQNIAKFKNIKTNLKQYPDKDGYVKVVLYKNGKQNNIRVHRLVAETFISNPENKPQVNHINGIKNDNRLENLEWNTASENIQHRIKVLHVSLKNNIKSKKVLQYDKEGRIIKEYPSAKEAGRQNNFSQGHISEVCRGEMKSYKGYIWKYSQ